MARTAPVPNFPAIPGMNPGIFVMGGGGDSGGSGAGGGKGGNGKQGAGGKNGGKDATGGGKGAGNCGAGSAGGCPGGHDGSVTKGDPVDVATGRVLTVPVVDARFEVLLETLAGRKLRFGAREVDPATYASAFAEQVSRGDDELRQAARRAYRSHFGVELVEPVRE